VDGILYGGGKGMLMLAEPIALCFEALCRTLSCRPRFIYMSPKGRILDQEKVKELSEFPNLAILCGHYEGVDERLIDDFVDEQISVGDYVVTGGELPALMLTDAISRLIPGVLSDKECFEKESHFNGLLEYPQYARPELWRERPVPEVLLSGHHEKINEWRTKQSLIETAEKRPDLLKNLFI
jgi:tRNA (guanine37-N1)-methyltransferase